MIANAFGTPRLFSRSAQGIAQCLHVLRHGRVERNQQAGTRMDQLETACVQGLTVERRDGWNLGNLTRQDSQAPAIDRVPDKGMSDVRHMYPYLVRPASLQSHADPRAAQVGLDTFIASHCRLAAVDDSHLLSIPGMPADRGIDGPVERHVTHRHRRIAAAHLAGLKLPHQMRVRLQRARDHAETGRILVQPVHDACPRYADLRREPIQQPIEQGTTAISRCRVHDQTRRLVDDEQVLVLMHHLDIDVFGLDRRGIRLRIVQEIRQQVRWQLQ